MHKLNGKLYILLIEGPLFKSWFMLTVQQRQEIMVARKQLEYLKKQEITCDMPCKEMIHQKKTKTVGMVYCDLIYCC